MPRPRKFSEADARRALLMAFWDKGYAATSLNDLETATGMGRRSLYNSFGDKHAVFLGALRDFRETAVEHNLAPLSQPGAGLASLRAVFAGLVDLASTEQGRLGCLICNTAREPVAREPDVRGEVEAYFRSVEDRFARALKGAKAQGEISAHADVTSLSRMLLGALVSISVLARGGEPIETLQAIANESLNRLED